MGIPYSREINAAFEQVTPLVAQGFQVLRTTKNISILLAVIQVLTVLILAMILFALLGILYSVNPDLEAERKEIVTPVFRWLAGISLRALVKSSFSSFLGIFVLGTSSYLLWPYEGEEDEIGRAANSDGDLDDKEKKEKMKKKTKDVEENKKKR
ncbi:uncharacterized protein BDR25DRAFT_88599 [Lindgomyces ingoldianus]|uniref:Uncharacterized protein n=1 Tax=Lindgomyces ingoldianus TaxID=673940 RepID=A0ACB6RB59_9PLEO|nr:uncharacterized protein BDR25DRAFT_88599 [Lindgomyces ingoldianus]KAF2475767.1 hypothetical protein BDR25DRAFT_88599 [Lindgomyces ingoldianus]